MPILIDFRFLYEDESEIDDANIFEVLYAAFYFKLDPLESECVKVLQDKVTVENVWLMLKEAISFDCHQLEEHCMLFFAENTTTILKHKSFLTMPHDIVLKFCDSEELDCSEAFLFYSCVLWAKRKCQNLGKTVCEDNLKEIMCEILKKIRFHTMTR